ncbi:MAG: hypothetical protein HY918_06025 [Candidatus Doudnabacteria bacterium]|nr:hypothetical protein [Candidatus Doudnabacteria bacterium]
MLKEVLIVLGFVLLSVAIAVIISNIGEARHAKATCSVMDRRQSSTRSWVWFVCLYFFGSLGSFALLGLSGLVGFASDGPDGGFIFAALEAVGFIVGTALVFAVNPLVAKMVARRYGLNVVSSPPPMDVL